MTLLNLITRNKCQLDKGHMWFKCVITYNCVHSNYKTLVQHLNQRVKKLSHDVCRPHKKQDLVDNNEARNERHSVTVSSNSPWSPFRDCYSGKIRIQTSLERIMSRHVSMEFIKNSFPSPSVQNIVLTPKEARQLLLDRIYR